MPTRNCDCISVIIGQNQYSATRTDVLVNGEATFEFLHSADVTYTISYTGDHWAIFTNLGVEIAQFEGNTDCPVGLNWITDYIEGIDTVDCNTYCDEIPESHYRLVECQGRRFDIFSTDTNLINLVGQIIRIPYFDNACFKVLEDAFSIEKHYYPSVEVAGVYTSCIDCYPKHIVEPEVQFTKCDPSIVEEVKCSFADMMHQQMMSKRLGIEFCCELDRTKWSIRNDKLDIDLLYTNDPPLPEPYIDVCCLDRLNRCCPQNNCGCNHSSHSYNHDSHHHHNHSHNSHHNNCGCSHTTSSTHCSGCSQPSTPCTSCHGDVSIKEHGCNHPIEDEVTVHCNCEASHDSPHDCHTYAVVVTNTHLIAAVGNTDTHRNGRVFFAYYKCKETHPTIVEYTVATTSNLCVLGIPLFGYYRANVWTPITAIARGAVCEEPIQNTCCHE